MFWQIFTFELWYRLRRPATYIYFGILFMLALLLALAQGGVFESLSGVFGTGPVKLNSPFTVNSMTTALTLLPGVLLISAMFGPAVLRDFETRMHPLLYTTPISKAGYLGGRFFGTLVITMLVLSGIGLGLWIGTLFPGIQPERLGPSSISAYLTPYLTFVLPNVLLTGAIFFVLATLTRQALSTYVGSIVFLVLYVIARSQLRDLDNQTLAALLDPMGNGALSLLTKYWTASEKNTLTVLPVGLLGLNRLIWLGVGLLLIGFCYLRFRFVQGSTEGGRRTRPEPLGQAVVPSANQVLLPRVAQQFGFAQYLRQWLRLTGLELSAIVKSPYFIAIVVAGMAFMLAAAFSIGKVYGTNTYPVTGQVVPALSGSFALFVLAIVTFYAGELVWRERDARLNQMYDALPIPNWVPFASKLAALLIIPVLLQVLVLVFGLLTQVFYGYFNFEIGLYLKWLFALNLPSYWLLVVLAIVIHVVVNHKYLGHFVMVLYYLFTGFAGQLGLEQNLLIYGSDSGLRYSALNGFGHFIGPYLWFMLYWGLLAVAMAVATNLLWVRGTETSWNMRQHLAARRFTGSARLALGLALALFVAVGGWIFYNTNILNDFRSNKSQQEETVQYEKKYRHFLRTPQPRIVAVDVQVDLFPERQEARLRGQYWLRNKTNRPIDSVVLNLVNNVRIRKLALGNGARTVLADSALAFFVQRLPQPLAPGDSLPLSFDLYYDAPGFENNTRRTSIVYNGTFINSQLMPHLGYDESGELSEESARKKYGLKPKPRMAALNDTAARRNTYIAKDADWVRFAATVSTSPDQIALAPGYLQREWREGGRRYFRYAMDAPILDFYSFQSARYAQHRAKWNNVDIVIYYQPGHEYNLARMTKGVQDALTYYTKNYGPYQHRQVRVVEFPGYASFAQSFPNTIPFSESVGFIAQVDSTNPKDVDYPYFITAHEVAHQWWAHQVIGADVQGSTLMSEALSEYSALMVMKQRYGEAMMRKFLKYEMDDYLRGRASENIKELPLYKVENQQYIHYRKGSVVLYALANYIGEDKVNRALSDYLQEVKFQEPPYTTSLDLLKHFQQQTPDSLQYLLTDMFRRITLYENKADSVTAHRLPNGHYRVDMVLSVKKMYADSTGNETPAKLMNDWIDVGVLARKKVNGQWQDVTLYRQKRRFRPGTTRLSVDVAAKPETAGIDPYNLLIDRTPDDNTKPVVVK
ncbi:ABC transporter permease/M1 family aminopeptidase [Hymenobacter sp. BT491]|uniref:ABC transporter permease/M1 family aminopeptidase n=1 Tax=Hymenobacter sp. BT491 TaxID=2766779 RepID=UPI001653AFBB|nr:M1 family aminopeptidase [Hymenobacter sp. BT491]MBC6992476.1 hypothetical protein [Hymenobacter sp. BT491]